MLSYLGTVGGAWSALALLFILSIPVYSSASAPLDYKTMFNALQQQGIPKDFLSRRTKEQIESLYQKCKGHNIAFGGSEITYLTEDGQVVSPYGAIPEYDLILEISPLYDVGDDGDGNNTYDACWMFVYFNWTSGHPTVRKVDALAVNWDPDMWTFDGEFEHTDYSDRNTIYSSVTRPTERNQGGLGYYAYLDTNCSNLIGETQFTLYPATTPLYPAGSGEPHFRSEVNVNYVHDKNPLPVKGVSISVSGVGVGIDFGSSADEASATYNGYYKREP